MPRFRKRGGSIYCSVHRTGFSGCLHGVSEGERDRGPQLRQGNGLPGGPQFTGDIRGRAADVRQEGDAERGMM